MTDTGFGIWAGTAINDTSSVVAAGFAFSDAAGELATIVKLTRTLMIIPITLALTLYRTWKRKRQGTAAAASYSIVKIFSLVCSGISTDRYCKLHRMDFPSCL